MQSKMRKRAGQSMLCALVAAGIGSASAAPKADDAVAYRQGILRAMGWNVGDRKSVV